MDRRTFATSFLIGAATMVAVPAARAQSASTPQRANNIVFVHGLFADGSSWSEVIPLLQARGLNVTSVQNPLTTLEEAVAACRKVLDRQDGPAVLAGHSFSGMIVTEAGVHPKVSALVYVAARAPDAGEDYTALAARFPAPPASAGIVYDGDEGRLSEEAFLRDFAAICPPRRRARCLRSRSRSKKRCWRGAPARPPGAANPASMPSRRKIGRSIPTCSALWRRGWARRRSSCDQAMFR